MNSPSLEQRAEELAEKVHAIKVPSSTTTGFEAQLVKRSRDLILAVLCQIREEAIAQFKSPTTKLLIENARREALEEAVKAVQDMPNFELNQFVANSIRALASGTGEGK